MLQTADVVFFILAFSSFAFGLGVILVSNPIYSALYLALTMISIAGIFVTLDALFVAAVQLLVYAGAVMVLFVMVLMLFDIKREKRAFSTGVLGNVFKILSAGLILGMVGTSILYSAENIFAPAPPEVTAVDSSKALATQLFTKYIFGFEAIGVLLLMVAIGAVTLSRVQGGTHDR